MIDYYDHIDDYVNGLLRGDELDAFEAAMAKDSGLASAVENHDVAMGVIGSLIEDEVRRVIEREKSLSSNPQVVDIDSRKNSIMWMNIFRGVAAACVVGFLGYWAVGEYHYGQLEDEIFAQHVPYLKVPTSKGSEIIELANLMDSIYFFYSHDQYDEALLLLSQQSMDHQLTNKEIKLSKRIEAYSLFHTKEYQKASEELSNIDPLKSDDRELLYHTLVLLGRKNQAKEQLSLLSADRKMKIKHLSE